MVWNIQFQVAALVLSLVVAGMCFNQKRLNFASELAFIRLLVGTLISISLDITSIVVINYRNSLPDFIVQFFCELYLLSIVLVACLSAWFAVAEISYKIKPIWRNLTVIPFVVEIVVLVLFKTGIHVNPEDGTIYTEGVTVFVTYVFCAFHIVTTLILVIWEKSIIRKRRRIAVYVWLVCWLAAGILQFFANELLLVSFVMSLAIVYMYCRLENPEYHLDFVENVFNKKGFHMLMEENIRFHRHKPLISISINNLNAINEIFGNKTVSAVITSVCAFLQDIPNTLIFRLEDNLLTIALESDKELDRVVDLVFKRMSFPWEIDQTQVQIETGISYLVDICDFESVDELEEVVHYFAYESGKTNDTPLLIDDEALEERTRTLEIQHALEWAIANDAVEMYYQPIYNIREGKFSAMEALVRIKDENGKLIMPGDFIEYAEKNGMILTLGEMVFRKVCEFVRQSKIEDYGIEYIEVNLSVVQCMQDDLAKNFKNIMAEYGIPPHRINLEITETAAINTRYTLERNMDDLIAYGTSFSLDDYGSGYSNLTYMVGMPLKIIKIDRSITIAYDSSEKARVATEYTVDMVHRLGMEIVVEGIETEEQYLNFKKLGVEYIQGYYFSKPLPKERVLNYVREWL